MDKNEIRAVIKFFHLEGQTKTAPAECLEVLQKNPTDFKKRFVTMDETWIYHYDPKQKISRNSGLDHVNRLQRKQKPVK
jgi:hypothetical protein